MEFVGSVARPFFHWPTQNQRAEDASKLSRVPAPNSLYTSKDKQTAIVGAAAAPWLTPRERLNCARIHTRHWHGGHKHLDACARNASITS